MRRWSRGFACVALCLLGALLLSGTALTEGNESAMGALERQAWQAYEEEDMTTVFALCEQAIEQDPKTAWAYVIQAYAYWLDINNEGALTILEQGIARGAHTAEIYYERARITRLLGLTEQALEHIKTAIALDDTNADAYWLEFLILQERGWIDEAIDAFDEIFSTVDSIDAAESGALRRVHMEFMLRELQGATEFEEASEYYLRWLRQNPQEAEKEQTMLLAEDRYKSGAYEEAIDLYEEAAGDSPLMVGIGMHYVDALVRLGRYEDALAVVEQDIGNFSEWEMEDVLLGDVYAAMGDLESAQYHYMTALEEFYAGNLPGQRLAALEERILSDALVVFQEPRWAGYAPVSYAYNEESISPSVIFVVMRRGDHNVLCLVERKVNEGYVLTLESDKAVYQGNSTPKMFYDGHMDGYLLCRYPMEGMDHQQPYEQELEFICDEDTGEWRFDRMAYCFREAEDRYSDISKLAMDPMDGRLALQWHYYDYRHSYLDEDEAPLADMAFEAGDYALERFDLTRVNKDFDALRQQGGMDPIAGDRGMGAQLDGPQGKAEGFDRTPYDDYVRTTYPGEAGSALTVPEDLDGDWTGCDEVVYRVGEERLLVLRLREGKVEQACPYIDFRGYGATSAQIVRMQGAEGKYIQLNLADGKDLQGFWLMRLEEGLYEFVEYSACSGREGKDEMVDSDGDGFYDGYRSERRSPEELEFVVTRLFHWDKDHFELESVEGYTQSEAVKYAPEDAAREYLAATLLHQEGIGGMESRMEELSAKGFRAELDPALLVHFRDCWTQRDGYDMAQTVQQDDGSKSTVYIHLRKDRRAFAEFVLVVEFDGYTWRIAALVGTPLDPAEAG